MAIQVIFKSTLPSCRYFTKDGVAVNFMSGRFTTDNKRVEEELLQEVGEVGRTKSRHPFIFIDENEAELDTEALSPLELIKLQAKEEARAELLAEIKANEARALDAKANVSSSSADYKASLNNTAKQEEDAAPQAAANANVMAAKLAELQAKQAAAKAAESK